MNFENLKVREKIENIEEMSKTPGYIVLDSSVICDLIRTHKDYVNIDFFDELELIKNQIDLSRNLKCEIKDNSRYLFPEEVKFEIEDSVNDYLISKRRRRRKTGRRKALKGYLEHDKNEIYSCCREIAKALGILIHERRSLVTRMRPLENELPDLEKSMLEDIKNTVLDLSDEYYDRNMKKRERRYSEGMFKNRNNDEIILAKSFALSEVKPVTVISKDWDLWAIYSEMFRNLNRFIENGMPGLPAYNLDLFIMHDNGDFQYFNPVMYAPVEMKRRFRKLG